MRYRRNTFSVIQAQSQGLDIDTRSEAYSVTLRQPLFRTLRREFTVALSLERQEDATSLLGEPFSFSLGAHRGRSVVTAVRLAFEWIDRTPTQYSQHARGSPLASMRSMRP
jgi:hemolysin activation/secretion protein